MPIYLVIVHRSGPEWQAGRPLEEQSGWIEHAAFMDALVEEGFILLGGPLADEHRVVHAVQADSADAVRARLAEDPWGETHLRVASIEPWTIRLDGRAGPTTLVRPAGPDDLAGVGRLLDAFNREYDEPTPGPERLAVRVGELLAGGDTAVLVAGRGPEGLAVLRFRAGLWSTALECYLAELYVVPERRGQGLGRALLTAAIEDARRRGADHMDLGTSEDDVAARALYERLGFTRREGGANGPLMYVYERDL